MHRHVVWDLGGTLVDTYPALDAAFADVVTRYGQTIDPIDVAALTRRSTDEAITGLSTRFGIHPSEFEQANAELKKLWKTTPPPVTPGAHRLMADIHASGGLNLVVTHRERSSAQSLIDGLGLQVDDLVSTSDGFPRKPDPTMFRALLDRHGIDASDCLAVGDRPIDIVAGHNAGMHGALLETVHVVPDGDPEHVVATLDELRPLLGL